ELVRLVVGQRGRVRMRTHLTIRFDYGSVVPWVQRTPTGIQAIAGPDVLRFSAPVPLRGQNFSTVAAFTVAEGQRLPFTMVWHPSSEPAPPAPDPERLLEDTQRWWEEWSGRCIYQGEWREAVLRSLITLKALTFAPTGGIVAAPTTSLPEHLGGVRNWDYRYCWLRDATFTLLAFMHLGYFEEANAWRDWLVRAVAGSPRPRQIMYGVGGERWLPELIVDWLPGDEKSAPGRVGNAAPQQPHAD